MTRYLIVAHQTAGCPELAAKVAEIVAADPDAAFGIVVPTTSAQHLLTWEEGETEAIAWRAASRARASLEGVGANVVAETIGDASALLASDDELRARPDFYEAISVSTLARGVSRWLRLDLPHRAEGKFGLAVTHVTAADDTPTMGGEAQRLPLLTDYLMRALGGKSTLSPLKARAALVAIGEPAVPALIEALGRGGDHERWEAAKALAEIASPDAAPALVGALEDVHGAVRWLAAEGLINLGNEALPPLLEALETRPDSCRLREGAHHVLITLRRHDLHDDLEPVVAALVESGPAEAVGPAAAKAVASLEREPAPVGPAR